MKNITAFIRLPANDVAGTITLANAAVPEPSTWTLLGFGAGMFGCVSLRRHRSRTA